MVSERGGKYANLTPLGQNLLAERLRMGCSGWVAAEEVEEQANELARRWGAETQKAGGTQKAGPTAED